MDISVVIPIYNAESTIKKAIESVLNQTISVYEIIIVNDGSTDNSDCIINSLIQSSSGIRFQYIKKENGGVSSARNRGLIESKGDIIALLDSDDEWLSDKLEHQLSVLKENPHVHFLGGLTNHPKKNIDELLHISFEKLVFKNYFQPSTVIFRREVFKKIGLFEQHQKYAEEGNYFMRIAREFNCFLMNKKLVNYGQGKLGFGVSGLSANLWEMEKGELKNLNFAYEQKYISTFTYIIATCYSVLKFIRRIVIVKLNWHV
jgi:glycosyltransferase involved in cell wall biosynthesis